jgi:hypothetical protein
MLIRPLAKHTQEVSNSILMDTPMQNDPVGPKIQLRER